MPAEARPQPPARPVVSCEQNRSPPPGLGMLPVGWSLTSCRVPAISPGGWEDASGSVTLLPPPATAGQWLPFRGAFYWPQAPSLKRPGPAAVGSGRERRPRGVCVCLRVCTVGERVRALCEHVCAFLCL